MSEAESKEAATGKDAGGGGDNNDSLPKPSLPVTTASRRFQQTQAQVDEVVGIMRTNVEKVLERDTKLSELVSTILSLSHSLTNNSCLTNIVFHTQDDRADALNQGASLFEQQAGKLKRKYWWQNLKMLALMLVVLIILILIFSEMFE